jgi:hypothetical protein
MNNVTFQLTDEDLLLWSREQAQTALKPENSLGKGRRRFLFVWCAVFCLIAVVMAGPIAALLLAGAMALSILFAYFALPFSLLQESRQRAWLTFGSRLERQPITVSLTPRGVLEADDCEERLTLYDAIEETEMTEKFLYARDKRGGVLLIPVRAFGGEIEARAFLIELQNRRMQSAVGLATSVVAADDPQTLPPAASVAPQPWWKAPQVGSEAEQQQKPQLSSRKTGN